MNLTTLDLGAFYLFESSEVENPRRIRFQPLLRMGLGLAVAEPRYNKLVVTGNFHQMLPRRFEFDFNARFENASHDTPRFELPSFGGAEVVRGYRRDDGLGRSLWSAQNELWVPLPVGDETSQGLEAMIREKVKLAPFFDVGGLYQTITTTPGVRSGAGIGVRFIYSPIIFKIDYGYGFGTAVNGGGRGRFYFSLGSNLPF
jgi:hemolysin activation/secretion protein